MMSFMFIITQVVVMVQWGGFRGKHGNKWLRSHSNGLRYRHGDGLIVVMGIIV